MVVHKFYETPDDMSLEKTLDALPCFCSLHRSDINPMGAKSFQIDMPLFSHTSQHMDIYLSLCQTGLLTCPVEAHDFMCLHHMDYHKKEIQILWLFCSTSPHPHTLFYL